MINEITDFLQDYTKKLKKTEEDIYTRSISMSLSLYMYVLSLILVHAKAIYYFDASWFVYFLPVIIVISIRSLCFILLGLSVFIANRNNLELDSFLYEDKKAEESDN